MSAQGSNTSTRYGQGYEYKEEVRISLLNESFNNYPVKSPDT